MKKKLLTAFYLCSFFTSIFSQNIQTLFDLGKSRSSDVIPSSNNFLSLSYEMFKPDSIGYTFWFIDFFFNTKDNYAGLGYTEIARNFSFINFPIQAHIEFNGGLYIDRPDDTSNFSSGMANAWLGGISWPVTFKNGASLETQVMYKFFTRTGNNADAQLSLIWFVPFWGDKLSCSGFFDVWTESKPLTFRDSPPFNKQMVIYSEPQLWYNLNKTFSIGGELRLSYNFVFNSTKLEVFPCMGIKCNL